MLEVDGHQLTHGSVIQAVNITYSDKKVLPK
jgi:hypothetical protein